MSELKSRLRAQMQRCIDEASSRHRWTRTSAFV